MAFNPQKHHRRSIRLQGYNYTQPGAYFVTICTHQRQCLFGEIIDGCMHLNLSGQFVQSCWKNLPNHFPFVELDTFIIMPNHLHGIIIITENPKNVGAKHSYQDVSPTQKMIIKNASPCPDVSQILSCADESDSTYKGTKSGSLAAILQNFKSVSTRKINQMNSTSGETIWQRNYHEHIIRDESSLHHIRHYITNNPKHWAEDSENPQN